jgi:hypothetical protein
MSDMLDCLAKYLDRKALSAFQPIFAYKAGFVSEDLRQEFDKYLADNPGPACAIASSFLSFLIEKSGADKKLEN